jgi:hypothetical protein
MKQKTARWRSEWRGEKVSSGVSETRSRLWDRNFVSNPQFMLRVIKERLKKKFFPLDFSVS